MSRRGPSPVPWVVGLLLLVGGLYAGAVWLQARGDLRLPVDLPGRSWLRAGTAERDLSGKVALPMAAVDIPAYTRVTRDHLWNRARGDLALVYLDADKVPPTAFRQISQIIGRVVDHDKRAGYVFTEDDFCPEGTREGLVAGVPPGKRMMLVETTRVKGLHGLQPGDRFDIIRTVPVEADADSIARQSGGPYGEQLALELRLANWSRQAEVRVIVRDALVVAPVRTRQRPTAVSSLTQGTRVRHVPVEELYVALEPSEVASLSEAIAVEADVRAIVRSGRPDADQETDTAELTPRSPLAGLLGRLLGPPSEVDDGGGGGRPVPAAHRTGSPDGLAAAPFRLIEVVRDGERRLVTVPARPASPGGEPRPVRATFSSEAGTSFSADTTPPHDRDATDRAAAEPEVDDR